MAYLAQLQGARSSMCAARILLGNKRFRVRKWDMSLVDCFGDMFPRVRLLRV
jgi:hypothetical protein